MSQWIHVAGMIRLDNLGAALVKVPDVLPVTWKNDQVKQAAENALGCACDYNSTSEEWDHCTVPCGSEGSLQYQITPYNRRDHGVCWGYVAIWGDLRDFGREDVPKIATWFNKALSELRKPHGFKPVDQMTQHEKAIWALSTFQIRDAVLCIEVEGQDGMTLLVWSEPDENVKESHV
jgi:hypothetical protein